MIIAICLDDNCGMLFNNRRQSRDKLLLEDFISYANGNKILINDFSQKLFCDYENFVTVNNSFLDYADENDVCFVENVDVSAYKNKITKLIVYKWNKAYPADFNLQLNLNDFRLTEAKEFEGSSHEKITREVYEL